MGGDVVFRFNELALQLSGVTRILTTKNEWDESLLAMRNLQTSLPHEVLTREARFLPLSALRAHC